MAGNTKERILDCALDLFSQKGMGSTSLQEIADSVGIVKSALFRHFAGKEEIWDTILIRMTAYYETRFGSDANLPPIPESGEALIRLTMRMLDFTIHDDRVRKTRRLLMIEQFRNERARELATKHFLTGLESMLAKIFAGMMANGSLREADPEMLAFAYTAPITAMVHLCDREPEREGEAIAKAQSFAEYFTGMYAVEQKTEERKD